MRAMTEEQEIVEQINKYFEEKKAFYLSGVVLAPYEGCWHEPNVFLICPKGTEDFDDNQLVRPLYASGQGESLKEIKTKEELIEVIENERTPCSKSNYRDIDDFTIGDASKPINCETPVHETYWYQAILNASEEYNISLLWKCDKCEREIEGDEYEGRPNPTGYRGNGGVGVIMEGCLCNDCVQEGLCRHCGQEGWPHECYDPEIAECGWSICQYCTEKLLDNVISGEIDWHLGVTIEWFKDERQLDFHGIESSKTLRIMHGDEDLLKNENLSINFKQLEENIEEMGIEDLDKRYDCHGVTISSDWVVNIAYKNMGR